MGRLNRRWQADEDLFANARQSVQGVSDDDADEALADALAWESAQQGGDQ